MCRKTETCLHNEHILAVHVAFNFSNIKTFINAQYTKYEASDEFVLISSNRQQFKQGGVADELEIYGSHYAKIVIYPMHLLCSLMTKRNR